MASRSRPSPRAPRIGLAASLVACAVCLLTVAVSPVSTLAEDDIVGRATIHADGTSTVASEPTISASNLPPGVIFPFDVDTAGLVPLWRVEAEADSKAAAAQAQADRESEARRAQEAELEAAERAREVARQHAEDEARRQRQEEADAIAAAAARAYAEHALATESAAHVTIRDPGAVLISSLERATLFHELLPGNAWQHVQAGRPFAVLILCACELDSDLDVDGLERMLVASSIADHFTLLWARPPTTHQFRMPHTYGLAGSGPALVIDNIPIGQHVEKYVFGGQLSRPHTASARDMHDFLAAFLAAPTPLPLLLRSAAPTTTTDDDSHARGRVIELVGSTFESVVLRSSRAALVMLYSPSCVACHHAAHQLELVARRFADRDDLIVARIDRTENDLPMVIRYEAYPTIIFFQSGSKTLTESDPVDHHDAGGSHAATPAASSSSSLSSSSSASSSSSELPGHRGLFGSRGWRAPLTYDVRAPLHSSAVESWLMRHIDSGHPTHSTTPTPIAPAAPRTHEDVHATPPPPPPPPPHSQPTPRHAHSTQQEGVAV